METIVGAESLSSAAMRTESAAAVLAYANREKAIKIAAASGGVNEGQENIKLSDQEQLGKDLSDKLAAKREEIVKGDGVPALKDLEPAAKGANGEGGDTPKVALEKFYVARSLLEDVASINSKQGAEVYAKLMEIQSAAVDDDIAKKAEGMLYNFDGVDLSNKLQIFIGGSERDSASVLKLEKAQKEILVKLAERNKGENKSAVALGIIGGTEAARANDITIDIDKLPENSRPEATKALEILQKARNLDEAAGWIGHKTIRGLQKSDLSNVGPEGKAFVFAAAIEIAKKARENMSSQVNAAAISVLNRDLVSLVSPILGGETLKELRENKTSPLIETCEPLWEELATARETFNAWGDRDDAIRSTPKQAEAVKEAAIVDVKAEIQEVINNNAVVEQYEKDEKLLDTVDGLFVSDPGHSFDVTKNAVAEKLSAMGESQAVVFAKLVANEVAALMPDAKGDKDVDLVHLSFNNQAGMKSSNWLGLGGSSGHREAVLVVYSEKVNAKIAELESGISKDSLETKAKIEALKTFIKHDGDKWPKPKLPK